MSRMMNPHTLVSQRGDRSLTRTRVFNTRLPETVRKKRVDEKRKRILQDAHDVNSENKKRKLSSGSNSDEEQPGPSFQLIPEKDDVWASPIFKFQLPVTCGRLKGTLNKDRMSKGEKCILFQRQWFTPGEFEKCAGMESFQNWKLTVRCHGTSLEKLIQEGHLKPGKYVEGCKKAEKRMFPSEQKITGGFHQINDKDEEDETETEQQQHADHDSSIMVIQVICADVRFEPGPETSWTSDTEFVREASNQKDGSWKNDESEDRPLIDLTEVSTTEAPLRKKREELLNDAEEEEHRRKRKTERRGDDEEQPGPSSLLILSQRKESKKICFSSILKKGEKASASDIFEPQLPVTCGDLKATLDKDKLAKAEKCILFENQWFTPGEFEKRAGKERAKNWKMSIRHRGSTLFKLMQEGHLRAGKFTGGCKKATKVLCPPHQTLPVVDEEEETEDEIEQQQDDEGRKMVFKVTCGAVAGILHKKRFASGTRGKSVRTETSWMSPAEFVKEASGQTDASWRRDIECEGKPLSVLIEGNMLRIHSVLCECELCQPDQEDLENQNKDDECCVCKREEGPHLVLCDRCPRCFHQKCHLPHVGDDMLGDDKPWLCTFCIWRNVQEWRYGDELEMQAALSQQTSQHVVECQYLLLFLCSADEEQTFASDPDNCNYPSVVQTRMWFGKIAKKLQKKIYRTVREFVSDVQLIFTNSAKNNRDDAELVARRSRLRELFDGEFKRVFNIREHL